MTNFSDTDEGQAWIATGASRETSTEIMAAIAFFADNLDEAEQLWNGDGWGCICNYSDMFERVTGNGLRDPADYFWGADGSQWWANIEAQVVESAGE